MINKVISDKLPGISSVEKFKPIIESKIWDYQSNNKPFNIFVIEYAVLNHSYASQINSYIALIADSINNNIKKSQDCYTIDENGRFIVYFSESDTDFDVISISKVFNDIKQKLGNYITIEIGIAEYPKNGTTYSDLVKAAILFNKTTRERAQKVTLPDDFSLNKIHESKNMPASKKHTKGNLLQQLNSLIKHLGNYDKYLSEHTAMVTVGSIIFAKELDLSWSEVEKISVAAILHDVGYVIFPKNIFQKPDKLTQEDWKLVKMHPTIACEQILRPMGIFEDYLPIIQNHHEFIDGSGYPKARKAEQIPLGSQIISIVDSYQSMTSDRAYRKALDFEDIIDVFIRNAGMKWEKELITAFTAMLADSNIRQKLATSKKLPFEHLIL